jgi:hypothetical protein
MNAILRARFLHGLRCAWDHLILVNQVSALPVQVQTCLLPCIAGFAVFWTARQLSCYPPSSPRQSDPFDQLQPFRPQQHGDRQSSTVISSILDSADARVLHGSEHGRGNHHFCFSRSDYWSGPAAYQHGDNKPLPQLWPSEYQALPCNTAAWLIDPRRTRSKAYTPSIIKKVAQLCMDTDVYRCISVTDTSKFRKKLSRFFLDGGSITFYVLLLLISP